MKMTPTLFLAAALLCGCSKHKPVASAFEAQSKAFQKAKEKFNETHPILAPAGEWGDPHQISQGFCGWWGASWQDGDGGIIWRVDLISTNSMGDFTRTDNLLLLVHSGSWSISTNRAGDLRVFIKPPTLQNVPK